MKKVLLLVIVLSITSFANAELSMSVTGTQTAVVSLDPIESINFYLTIPSTVDYTLELIPPVSSLSSIGDVELYDDDGLDWRFMTIANIPYDNPVPGPQVLVTLTGDASFTLAGPFGGNLSLWDQWDDFDSPHTSIPISVPEPATVLLLGSGGLVLRRRRNS